MLFNPIDSNLGPMTELEGLSEIHKEDVEKASKKWMDNPPDRAFEAILEAKEAE